MQVPSEPETKLLKRPQELFSVLTLGMTFTLQSLMTSFHFLENIEL